jgi:hypothetical protein
MMAINAINPITTTIYGDEPAWAYQEIHLQSPFNRGFRRYRVILVNRDGYIAEYREDMGPASKFKGVKQINIPSLWEHTCDELRDLGDYLRNETKIDIKDLLQLDDYKPA